MVAKKKEGSGIIINNINVRPVVRARSDTASWRNALKAADASEWQIRVTLLDLIEDCMLDAVLSDQCDKLRMSVTGQQLQFLIGGEEEQRIMELIETESFYEMQCEIVNTRLYGSTVGEISFQDEFNFTNIPRKHIRPLIGKIAREQSGMGEIDYRTPPTSNFILEVGKPRDLGKLLKAVPYVLYKRGGLSDWAQFSEIFGMPMRIARYDGYNDDARQQAQKALDEAGAAMSLVLPKEVTFEMIENKTNVDGAVYNRLMSECDKQISILILGQTETTMSSEKSGYAQSKTHGLTKGEIEEDTRKYVLRVLNSKFKKLLELHGFNVKGGTFSYKKSEEQLTSPEKIGVWNTAKNMGVPIGDEEVYETFNIPKPKNYDELKAQKEEEQQQRLDSETQMRATNSVSWWNSFRDFFAHALK